jgi:hypothetical protein
VWIKILAHIGLAIELIRRPGSVTSWTARLKNTLNRKILYFSNSDQTSPVILLFKMRICNDDKNWIQTYCCLGLLQPARSRLIGDWSWVPNLHLFEYSYQPTYRLNNVPVDDQSSHSVKGSNRFVFRTYNYIFVNFVNRSRTHNHTIYEVWDTLPAVGSLWVDLIQKTTKNCGSAVQFTYNLTSYSMFAGRLSE